MQSYIKAMVEEVILASIQAVEGKNASLMDIEKTIVTGFMSAAAKAVGYCLSRYDLDCPYITYNGRKYKKSSRHAIEYFTSAGKVRVERSLYRNKLFGTVCPLNLNAGIVQKNWTPQAAKIATLATAEMTPYTGEKLFREIGAMMPSKSSLDRLPKRLHSALNVYGEQALASDVRESTPIPKEATKIAISLDGVHVPIQKLKGKKRYRRDSGFTDTRGSYFLIDEDYSPYREASCGTVSYLDSKGKLLLTHYYGRMPEEKKVKLKNLIKSHVDQDLASQPALELITIADGAKDNWTFLEEAFPNSTKILDFYHAAEHLKSAIDTVYKNKKEAIEIFEEQRSILRHDTGGIDRIIAFLEEYLKGDPENSDLMREIQYFKNNRNRCRYQAEAENDNPIGSGVVESACKSLVAKRLKCSGMAWRWEGGQAILNFRSYLKSGLFDQLWNVIAKSYSNPVFSAVAS